LDICDKFLCYVVLHYGDINLTNNCLKSLKAPDENVFVVVNGKDEEAEKILSIEFPSLKKIVLEKNSGFAKGMNEGIKKAIEERFDWIMILNNDVECYDSFYKTTKEIAESCGERKIVFSPVIYDKDGEKIWFSEGKFSKITGRAKHLGFGKKEIPQEKRESDYLTGCAMCFPSKAVKEAGMMDEEYFLYWEDVDWSLRLKKAGYGLFVYPELKIKHIGSASTQLESKKYLYYYFRNHLRFIFKNISCFLAPVVVFFYLLNLLRIVAAWILFQRKDKKEKIGAVVEGIKDFMLNRKGEKVFN